MRIFNPFLELTLLFKSYKGYVFLMCLRLELIEGSGKITKKGMNGLTVKQWGKLTSLICKVFPSHDRAIVSCLRSIKQQNDVSALYHNN